MPIDTVHRSVRADRLDHRLLQLELESVKERQHAEITWRRFELTGQVSKLAREIKVNKGARGRLALDDGLLEKIRELEEHAGELQTRLVDKEKLLNKLASNLDVLERSVPSPERTRKHYNAITSMWRSGHMNELSAVLALVVDYVDLRLDHPKIFINPNSQIHSLAALTTELLLPTYDIRKAWVRAA